jgi:DNA-binding transcriptional LysR family regulator
MDIRRLEAFAKVYELRSFSKAGQDLFLSQPTISAHIAGLESELGVALFDRLGRTVLPTKAGDILYGHAKKTFACLQDAAAEIGQLREGIGGSFLLGASTIPADYILPKIMADFLRRYPEVSIQLNVGGSRSISEQVLAGEMAIGLVGAVEDDDNLSFRELLQDELLCIASPDLLKHCGLGEKLDEPGAVPWVMREQGSGTRKTLTAGLKSIGLDARKLRVALSVPSTAAVLQCVRAGLGVSAVSAIAAQEYLDRGECKALSIEGLSMRRSFFLVHHKKRSFFPVVEKFIETVNEYCRRRSDNA